MVVVNKRNRCERKSLSSPSIYRRYFSSRPQRLYSINTITCAAGKAERSSRRCCLLLARAIRRETSFYPEGDHRIFETHTGRVRGRFRNRQRRNGAPASLSCALFLGLRRRGVNQLADRPDMIGDPHRHRRGDPQGLMDSAHIEVCDVQAHGGDVVRQLL